MEFTRRRRTTRSGKYWFDAIAARFAVDWIESHCHHTEGEWFGRAFILRRDQRRIVRKLFGWKRSADNRRRFRRLWYEVGRKNGKTEFAAALALYLWVGLGENAAQIYSLATNEDQAKIVFAKACVMAGFWERRDRDAAGIEILVPSLWCGATLSSFKPLSAKPRGKHGFSPSGIIGDEVHEWETGELYETVHEGEGARAEPLDVLITTAGKHGEGYAWEQHEHALAVLRREQEDDELLVAIFAAGEEDDWTDPVNWKKANPGLGISPKREFLESECRAARASPRKQNRFRQYYLNQWVGQATRWLPMEYWDLCTAAPHPRARAQMLGDEELDDEIRRIVTARGDYDAELWKKLPERMQGKSCAGGLDLATVRDICSLVWEFEDDGVVSYVWRFFLPRDTMKTLSRVERSRYEKFVEVGALTLTPGNVADYGAIKKQILDDSNLFRIRSLGIDRWNATQLATELSNTEGLPVVMFGQGFASMSGPSKDFERRVLGLALEHGNNPVARWMADNVAVDEDAHDNIKPTKEKSAGKVDGIVAAAMARGVAMANPVPAGPSLGELIESGNAIG